MHTTLTNNIVSFLFDACILCYIHVLYNYLYKNILFKIRLKMKYCLLFPCLLSLTINLHAITQNIYCSAKKNLTYIRPCTPIVKFCCFSTNNLKSGYGGRKFLLFSLKQNARENNKTKH